jgi:amino acid transporter
MLPWHASELQILLTVVGSIFFELCADLLKKIRIFSLIKLSCTLTETLLVAVPYDNVDADSALVEMFGQVGAIKCKYIVAVGALAGLTVSMFGSMFPMPRIVYAMAQDGLVFR